MQFVQSYKSDKCGKDLGLSVELYSINSSAIRTQFENEYLLNTSQDRTLEVNITTEKETAFLSAC